jgi:hypothetical protein
MRDFLSQGKTPNCLPGSDGFYKHFAQPSVQYPPSTFFQVIAVIKLVLNVLL